MTRIGNPQSLQTTPTSPQQADEIPGIDTGQVVYLEPAYPERLDKSGCQLRVLASFEGVGAEKGPNDESLQSSAA